MYILYGRDRNKGGYQKILASTDYSMENTLPSSDLNTFEGDRPGVFSFKENNSLRFIGVVIPHPEGTPSDTRPHSITHVIGERISVDSVWTCFNKDVLKFFYHGFENDVCSCIASLNPRTIFESSAKLQHVEDKDLEFNQCQRLLRYLKFYPDTNFSIQCSKHIEHKLFKFLGDNLEEPIALNLESSCRININGLPRVPFFSTLNYNDLPPFELNYTFESEEFDIAKLRRRIYEIYSSFDNGETEEAATFWETEKAKILAKLIASNRVNYFYKTQALLQILLFIAEKNVFVKPETLFYDAPSLGCLYDFSTLESVLKELPLSNRKKRKVIKNVKKFLSLSVTLN